jgi:hypothetical protein
MQNNFRSASLNVNFKNRSPIIECAFRKGKASPLIAFEILPET